MSYIGNYPPPVFGPKHPPVMCSRCKCCSLIEPTDPTSCCGPCEPCGHHAECEDCKDKDKEIIHLRDLIDGFIQEAKGPPYYIR
jgi:hypothetical protein